jgi:hypothetical protein
MDANRLQAAVSLPASEWLLMAVCRSTMLASDSLGRHFSTESLLSALAPAAFVVTPRLARAARCRARLFPPAGAVLAALAKLAARMDSILAASCSTAARTSPNDARDARKSPRDARSASRRTDSILTVACSLWRRAEPDGLDLCLDLTPLSDG